MKKTRAASLCLFFIVLGLVGTGCVSWDPIFLPAFDWLLGLFR